MTAPGRTPGRGMPEQAGEARRAFEVVVDPPWSRLASLWLDALVVLSEQHE
jgi:hypothetical protein